MSVKYSRDDFRENARGTRRHVEYLKDPAKRGVLQRSSTRMVLFTGLFACVGLYLVSLLLGGGPKTGTVSVHTGTGTVVHKQIEDSAGDRQTFIAEIEIAMPGGEPQSGFVELAQDVWKTLEVGQKLPVGFTYDPEQGTIEIVEITLTPG